jgi:hypothetical protein
MKRGKEERVGTVSADGGVDLDGAQVDLRAGLYLEIVAVGRRLPLPPYVLVDVLRHELREVRLLLLLHWTSVPSKITTYIRSEGKVRIELDRGITYGGESK